MGQEQVYIPGIQFGRGAFHHRFSSPSNTSNQGPHLILSEGALRHPDPLRHNRASSIADEPPQRFAVGRRELRCASRVPFFRGAS